LKNDRTSLSPGQNKKALAAIGSISGNLQVHFPDVEKKFLADLKTHHAALFDLAMKKRVIKKPSNRPRMPLIAASEKTLAALGSVVGNLRVYFPDIETGFTSALKSRYPEFFKRAVESGVVKGVPSMSTDVSGLAAVAVDRSTLTSGAKSLPGRS
jgi:hypothetical protein